ncbi:hypothetical protein QEZ54_34450, partial [Catellatospora sp. KI3]|uniref:hypothetical protein n=1 Tax=Catellatospora sp. KI3 TaxID=3041620 RepID=UPI00248265B3
MDGRGYWRRWWPAARRPALVIAVLGLVSYLLGSWPAVEMSVAQGPQPAAVCPMLRPQLLNLVVPGRVSQRDTTRPLNPEWPVRGAWCEVGTNA